MAWTPKPLAELPFLLVGPILRKVTPNSVSVFIVTKAACGARLRVYNHTGNTTAPNLVSATNTPFEYMTQLGTNLFLKVLTVSVGTNMVAGQTYGYDIEFSLDNGTTFLHLWEINPIYNASPSNNPNNTSPSSNSNNANHITTWGIDHFEFIISGSSQKLPTFVLPPTDPSKIRILHGSCRKPHGEGPDAMEQIYKIINDNAVDPVGTSDPTTRRPQMLFLTGDQIYADDVSDSMLYMIDKYADLLVGWDEDLAPLGCDITKMAPGERGDNIVDAANFSVEREDAGSHLMKLREYAIMYCMVWSNALWEVDLNGNPLLPSFVELYPDELQYDHMNIDREPFEFETHRKKENIKHINYLSLFFHALNKNMTKILANIPIYMMFDDHEVTDDLFYNGEWFNKAITNSLLGKRVCSNGMAAYALFQDWGNKPEDYNTGSGANLLTSMNYLGSNLGSNSISWNDPQWDNISQLVLPKLQLQTAQTPAQFTHGVNAMTWNYYYEVSNAYEFLVLDTRSMRVFNNGVNGVPGLMSEDALTKQIDLPSSTIPGHTKSKSLIFIVSPTPVIGVNYIEGRKAKAIFLGKSKELMDYEHWSLDKQSYEHLFSKIFKRNPNAEFLQVVMLGGDVHYGYSSQMKYWAIQPYLESAGNNIKKMIISNLCSSGFKNEVSACNVSGLEKTKAVEAYTKAFHNDKLTDLWDKNVMYGWQNLTGANIYVTIYDSPDVIAIPPNANKRKINMIGSPATFDRNRDIAVYIETLYTQISNNPSHDWHYRIAPMKNINPGFVPAPVNGYSMEDYKNHLQTHKEGCEKAGEGGEYIVGCNNLGDVMTEITGSQGITFVRHQLWWANDYERWEYSIVPGFPDIGQPYTIHKIEMLSVIQNNEPSINIP